MNADAIAFTDDGPRCVPQCCSCGRFVSIDTAHQHVEYGDYGTVHSVEFECEPCAVARQPVEDGEA